MRFVYGMENDKKKAIHIITERERFKKLPEVGTNIDIISENKLLSGFKLYIVEDWVLNPSKLFWSFLEQTNNSEDKVLVSLVKPKNTTTSQAALQNVYSKLEAGLHQKKTDQGMALLGDPKQMRGLGLSAQLIADGDFDQHVELIAYQITLRRLGCDSNKGLPGMESLFQNQYKNYVQSDDVRRAAETLVRDIQTALTQLHYLPFMSRVDGLYGDILVSAVKKFQLDHNEKPEGLPKLPVNGIVTADVLAALQAKLIALKKKLDILGFNKTIETKGTPTFSQLVKMLADRNSNDGNSKPRPTPSTNTHIQSTANHPLEATPPTTSLLTDEERNLLDSLGKPELKKSKETKDTKEVRETRERKGSKKGVDPIERELLKKLSALSTSVSSEQLVVAPPSPQTGEADIPGECYVVCERERCKSWVSEFDLDLVTEREVMTGYRLSVVEEWLLKSAQFWSVIEFTGNVEDKIIVCVVRLRQRPNGSTSSPGLGTGRQGWLSLLQKTTLNGFYTIQTLRGQMTLYDKSNAGAPNLTLIHIPDGDFDKNIPNLRLQLTLRRLGCTPLSHTSAPLSLQGMGGGDQFSRIYGPYLAPRAAQATLMEVTTNFVKEIQAALCHLNYLPLLAKIDGVFDTRTLYAVKAFQTDLRAQATGNPSGQSPPPQNPDGVLDSATYKAIRNQLMELCFKLEALGFQLPEDPVRNYQAFNEQMKKFQASYGIYPEAPGKNLLTYLERLNLSTGIAEGSGFSMKGAKGVEQYLPTPLPDPGMGCVSFQARATDAIHVILNATPTSTSGPGLFYNFVIGISNNTQTVLRRGTRTGEPCATGASIQALVSPGVWDTYWVSIDARTGWLSYGKGEARNSNLLLKWRDMNPIREVVNIGLSCWESTVEFAHIKVGPPIVFPGSIILDSAFLPLTPPTTSQAPSGPESAVDRTPTLEETNSKFYARALARSVSPTNLPTHLSAISPSLVPIGRSVSPITSPLSHLDSSGIANEDGTEPQFFGGHHSSSYPNIALAGSHQYRRGDIGRDPSDISDDEFDEEVMMTREEREEREALKATVERLTATLEAQQAENQKLRALVDELSSSYSDLKEQALKAIAHVSINERLLRDVSDKCSRAVLSDIPDIVERLDSNTHTLQSYSVKVKRLDEIVSVVQRKNERNFSLILWRFLSYILAGLAFFVLGLTTVADSVKRWIVPPTTNTFSSSGLGSGSSVLGGPSSFPGASSGGSGSRHNSEESELGLFLKKQRLKLLDFIEELDEESKTNIVNSPVRVVPTKTTNGTTTDPTADLLDTTTTTTITTPTPTITTPTPTATTLQNNNNSTKNNGEVTKEEKVE